MAYPSEYTEFREIENIPGLFYDPDDKRTFFMEDLLKVDNAIIALEHVIGLYDSSEHADITTFLAFLNTIQQSQLQLPTPYNFCNNSQFLDWFEDNPIEWYGGGYTVERFNVGLSDGCTGNVFARLTFTSQYGGIGQAFEPPNTFWAVEGMHCSVVCRYRYNGTSDAPRLIVQENGGDYTDYGSVDLDQDEWTIVQYDFTVPSGDGNDNGKSVSCVLQQYQPDAPGTLDIDFVMITPFVNYNLTKPFPYYRALNRLV